MTDGSSQAYVMVSAVGHVIVLAQQLGHNLAFPVARAAVTGRFVQLLDVWRDDTRPFDGRCRGPSIASPSDGPISSS